MDPTKSAQMKVPECMKMKLPFSDIYLAETKLRILRKNLQELGYSESECFLIMKKRRLLRCKKYVREYRKRERKTIEMLEKQKIQLGLEKDELNFYIDQLKCKYRIEMDLISEI